MGLSDYDIASTLATSISQRLVRKICTKCRKEREFTDKEKKLIEDLANRYNVDLPIKNVKTYDAVGCKYCNDTGYYERMGLFEILDITDDLKELIMAGASSIEIKRKALEGSYKPLVIDGIKKVLQGLTTIDELNKKLVVY